jgi:hypothetical protein
MEHCTDHYKLVTTQAEQGIVIAGTHELAKDTNEKVTELILRLATKNGIETGRKQAAWWKHPLFISAASAMFILLVGKFVPRLFAFLAEATK